LSAEPRRPLLAVLVVLGACLAAGCGASTGAAPPAGPGPAPAGAAPPAAGPGPGAVSVSGDQLLRDGRPWVARGLVSIAFVAPPSAATGVFAQAYRHVGPAELAAMRAWGADSVRFQVSQPGLDPRSPLFSQGFLNAVVGGVRAARAAGLTVLLSVQDESQSGERAAPTPLPDDATRRVWAELAPRFRSDHGVLFELLNEPRPAADPAHWAAWQQAMNATIATVRGTGAGNVLVADGLLLGERLTGAPALSDPSVVYASHPYAHDAAGQTPQAWDQRFGTFARTHPVLVTEWTTIPRYYCDANTAQAGRAFLSYLAQHRIGLFGFAYDFAGDRFGSVAHGFPARPTSYAGTSCGSTGFGPGRLVQDWYRTGSVPAGPE
jgi:endoglucanase